MKPSPRSSEEVKEKIQNQNWQRRVGMLGERGGGFRKYDVDQTPWFDGAGRIGEVELRMGSDINQ
jgi:hypothetical protein